MRGRTRRLRALLQTPADVKAVVDGAPGERLLTWGRDVTGDPLVATDAGLWAYGERLAWIEIDHVTWADRTLAILAIDGEVREVPVGEERDLPVVIRAQIDASVVTSVTVPLTASGRGATVVARRGGRGEIEWRVRFDQGVNAGSPEHRRRVDEVLAAVRAELGI